MNAFEGLNFSGLACLRDLELPELRVLFQELEQCQAEFLSKEHEFRSPEYPWPRDPLHTWSRVWEYPYVAYHVRRWLQGRSVNGSARVVDLGSGVTFLPFALARWGCHVLCLDTDPIVVQDLTRAANVVAAEPGQVVAQKMEPDTIPIPNESVDLLLCVSVLEHVQKPKALLEEMERVTRQDGRVILTMDLDLRGDQALSVTAWDEIYDHLRSRFEFVAPPKLTHPADILRSDRGPYREFPPLASPKRAFWNLVHAIRSRNAKVFLRLARIPFLLAVVGLVLKKRSRAGGQLPSM